MLGSQAKLQTLQMTKQQHVRQLSQLKLWRTNSIVDDSSSSDDHDDTTSTTATISASGGGAGGDAPIEAVVM